MKVHIVTNANRARYSDALIQMHKQRHRLFIDELGWRALRSRDGLEIDEYDDQYAVYLLAICDGEVRGSSRLLPSWRRSLTSDRLSNFLLDGVPTTGPDIWEWTRYVPGDKRQPRRLVESRKLLMLAGLEFGLSRGIEAFTAVCDSSVVSQLVDLGWNPAPLGMPTRFAEGTATAITWRVTPEILRATEKIFGEGRPASIEAPPYFGAPTIEESLVSQMLANVIEIPSAQALAKAASLLVGLVHAAPSYPATSLKYAGGRQ